MGMSPFFGDVPNQKSGETMSDKRRNNPDPGPAFEEPVGERPGGDAATGGDRASQQSDTETAAPSASGPCVDFDIKPRKAPRREPGVEK